MRKFYFQLVDGYMSVTRYLKKVIPKDAFKILRKIRVFFFHSQSIPLREFRFDQDDVKNDIRKKYNFSGKLLDIFTQKTGTPLHKWHHYIPIYDRYFSKFLGKKIKFLEIGVLGGGSLEMWRKYFGEDAIIFGIDIDEECSKLNGIHGQVRIGSQDDENFLMSVIEEMGGVDIVLDDGSHLMEHIKKSLEVIYPKLEYGGIYMIEDLHTAFFNAFGGGFYSTQNFFNFIRKLTDDMHHWYHKRKMNSKEISENISSIHIYDSIVVIEKNKTYKPTHSILGK